MGADEDDIEDKEEEEPKDDLSEEKSPPKKSNGLFKRSSQPKMTLTHHSKRRISSVAGTLPNHSRDDMSNSDKDVDKSGSGGESRGSVRRKTKKAGTHGLLDTTFTKADSTLMDGEFDSDDEFEAEPIKPDKANFIFGMHPLQADNVVIDPNYPPQFFPYLYPHLYPHLFPKLYPHYCKNYEEVMKKKKKDKKKKHEKRDIIVVLPDGRNIMMSRKEFLAYQLALAQMGHKVSDKDLMTVKKDPLLDDSKSVADGKSVALSANIPSEPDSPKKKRKTAGGKKGTKPSDPVLKDLDSPGEGPNEGPGKPKLLDPNQKPSDKSKTATQKGSKATSKLGDQDGSNEDIKIGDKSSKGKPDEF